MGYQPKVNQTQKYSDSQGEHIVHEGKLILLDTVDDELNTLSDTRELDQGEYIEHIRPIIISETEKIEAGDKVLHEDKGIFQDIYEGTEDADVLNNWNGNKMIYKILALPEHFSYKHLQAIVDGKMKDGDEVLVKCVMCDYKSYRSSCGGDGWLSKDHGQASETCPNCNGAGHFIHLNQQNHITLFPAQQSLEEASNEVLKRYDHQKYYDKDYNHVPSKTFEEGAEWAVKNNYKGEQ